MFSKVSDYFTLILFVITLCNTPIPIYSSPTPLNSLASADLFHLRQQFHDLSRTPSLESMSLSEHEDNIRNLVSGLDEIQSNATLNHFRPFASSLTWWDLKPESKLDNPLPRLQICIVVSSFEGMYLNSGIGTAYTALAELLVSQGHSVSVFYTREEPTHSLSFHDWVLYYREKGITVSPLPPSQVRVDASYVVRRSFEVYQHLKEKHFDVIHFPDFEGLGYYSLLAKHEGLAFLETKMVVGIHGPTKWVFRANHGGKHPSQESELEVDFLERMSVELADVAWSPSKSIIEWMRSENWILPPQTVLLPLPTGSEVKSVLSNITTPLSKSPTQVQELVFFGRLEARKGLILFCDALDLLSNGALSDFEPSSITVTFLGRSSRINRESALTYISNRAKSWSFKGVNVLSSMSRLEALKYLSEKGKGRLAVIPSLSDNAPYTVSECLYTQIPFIASSIDSISDLIASQSDKERVLFEAKPYLLVRKLSTVFHKGAAPATPTFSINQVDAVWSQFYIFIQALPETSKTNLSYSPTNIAKSGFNSTIQTPQPLINETPLVSVVIVHFNRPTLLAQAIQSIEQQDYKNYEIILVDDGSNSTESLEYLQQLDTVFSQKGWIIIRTDNRYLGAARNTGSFQARGKYIMFLDDDNFASPHQISTFVKAALYSQADVLTAPHLIFTGSSVPTERAVQRYWVPLGASLSVGLFRNCFGDANFFINRDAFIKSGGFTEEYLVGQEDHEFLAKLVLQGYHLEVVPEPLLYYRIHDTENQMLFSTDPVLNQMRYTRPFVEAISKKDPSASHRVMKLLAKRSLMEVKQDCNQTLTAVSPTSGPINGGTLVTITGSGFSCGVTSVLIGGSACTGVAILSNTELTCYTPKGAAVNVPVDISVDVGDVIVSLYSSFTYLPLQPPNFQYCLLSDDGLSIDCYFDTLTDEGNMTAPSNCSNLLDFTTVSQIGNPPTCSWSDAKTLVITLGPSATINCTSGSITLIAGSVHGQGFGGLPAPSVTVTLQCPGNPLTPTAVISAPSVLGPCDQLALDGSSSLGSAGRPLVFSWELISIVPPSPSSLDLNSTLTSTTANKVNVPNDTLAIGTYVFSLTVSNWLGKSNTVQATVIRSTQSVPQVSIAGPAIISVYSITQFTIDGQGLPSACNQTETDILYVWSVEPFVTLDASSVHTQSLFIDSGTLSVGVSYIFTLNVSSSQDPSLTNSASVTVDVDYRPIIVGLTGGNRQYSSTDTITLDGSTSHDPDNAGPLTFEWECVDYYSPNIPCRVNLGLDSSVSFLGDQLGSGKYTFSLIVGSQGHPYEFGSGPGASLSRSSSASVSIEVLDTPFIAISIEPLADQSDVDLYEKIALRGMLEDVNVSPSDISWLWTLESGSLAVIAESAYGSPLTSKILTINANSLYSGTTYTFSLVANDTNSGVTGSASITFTTSSASSTGTLTCDTTQGGTALNTPYSFEFGSVNSAGIIGYGFSYIESGEVVEVPLQDTSSSPSISTTLPSGQLTLVGYVLSASGVILRQTCSVGVSGSGVALSTLLSQIQDSPIDVFEVAKILETAQLVSAGSNVDNIKEAGLSQLQTLLSGSPRLTSDWLSAALYALDRITMTSTGELTSDDLNNVIQFLQSLVPRLSTVTLTPGSLGNTVHILSNIITQFSNEQNTNNTKLLTEILDLVSSISEAILAFQESGSPTVISAGGVTVAVLREQASQANLGTSIDASGNTPSFSLPQGFLDSQNLQSNASVSFHYTLFTNNPFGGMDTNSFVMLNGVIGLELSSSGETLSIHGLTDPITISISPSSSLTATQQDNVECVFWNTTINQWDTNGCTSQFSGGKVICSCTHLTYFAVWAPVDTGSKIENNKNNSSWSVGKIVGVAVGGFCGIALIVGAAVGGSRYRRNRQARRPANPPAQPANPSIPPPPENAGEPSIPTPIVPVPQPQQPNSEGEEVELGRRSGTPINAVHEDRDEKSTVIPQLAAEHPTITTTTTTKPTEMAYILSEFNDVLEEFKQKERDNMITPPKSKGSSPGNAGPSKRRYGPYNESHTRATSVIQKAWRKYQSKIDRRREREIEQLLYDIDELLADESDPFDLEELDMN